MNKEQTVFYLREARDGIESILEKFDNGDYGEFGDFAFGVDILTALNYLNNSWHCRNIESNELTSMTQEEYEKSSFTIPNLDVRLRILDLEKDPFK